MSPTNMDLGWTWVTHQSSWLGHCRPARAGLPAIVPRQISPEAGCANLPHAIHGGALALEAAWIRESCSAGADSWRCEANRVEVRRFGLTGANLPAIVPRQISPEAGCANLPHAIHGGALALEAAWVTGARSTLADNWGGVANRAFGSFHRERGEAVRGADDDGSEDLAEHQVF